MMNLKDNIQLCFWKPWISLVAIILILSLWHQISGQSNIYNKNAVIYINDSATISFDGNFLSLPSSAGLSGIQFNFTDTTSRAIFHHNLINNSSDSAFSSKPQGYLVFMNSADKHYKPFSSNQYNPGLIINKINKKLILDNGFRAINAIRFVNGNLDIRNYNISLESNDMDNIKFGHLENESNNCRIIADTGKVMDLDMSLRAQGNEINFLGLGLNYNGLEFGIIGSIIRGHKILDSVADGSIKKYFEITKTNDDTSKFQTGIRYFDNSDFATVPGNTIEADFRLWYSKTPPYTYFTKFNQSTVDVNNNVVTGNDTLTLGQGQTIRLTVADERCDIVPKFSCVSRNDAKPQRI